MGRPSRRKSEYCLTAVLQFSLSTSYMEEVLGFAIALRDGAWERHHTCGLDQRGSCTAIVHSMETCALSIMDCPGPNLFVAVRNECGVCHRFRGQAVCSVDGQSGAQRCARQPSPISSGSLRSACVISRRMRMVLRVLVCPAGFRVKPAPSNKFRNTQHGKLGFL